MSTRATINFTSGQAEVAANGPRKGSHQIEAKIYRHYDGYPDGVLPDLAQFFATVEAQTDDHRFDDPSYLAAKYVVWQAASNAGLLPEDGQPKANVKPLDFLGVGVLLKDPDDIEYTYFVNCARHDEQGRPRITYKKVA